MAEVLLIVSLALLARQIWMSARRRSALNRALHEVRRPLQALALSVPQHAAFGGVEAGPVWQAISAVGRLDRELNGTVADEPPREPVAMRLLVEACVRRAGDRAGLDGSRVRLRWAGPDALVLGDAAELSAAIDNLILNAIEHGGPEIVVNVTVVMGHLRLEVLDSGSKRKAGPGPCRRRRDRRHGHGLAVAGGVARRHGGRLDRDFSDAGSRVTLVLPLSRRPAAPARRLRIAS